MKTTRFFFGMAAGCLVLGCLALWPHSGRAAVTTNAPAKGKPGATTGTNTNKVDVVLPVPTSVFDVAIAPTKDPFFPNSLRHAIRSNVKEAPGVSANSFVLMALSGSADARLAMINHRTLGVGEAVEVMTPNGSKVTIRVLQIKDSSVIIRVVKPPQPDLIELSLGGDKSGRVYMGVVDATHPQ